MSSLSKVVYQTTSIPNKKKMERVLHYVSRGGGDREGDSGFGGVCREGERWCRRVGGVLGTKEITDSYQTINQIL